MKLIDILVEELPRRGGWPKRAANATQDEDGEVCFSRCRIPDFGFASWNNGDWVSGAEFHTSKATDYAATIITANSTKPRWLPKVTAGLSGVVVSVQCHAEQRLTSSIVAGAVSENQQAWPKHHKESDVVVNPFSNAGQAFWRHENSVVDIIAYRLHQPQEVAEVDEEADLNECIGQDVQSVWSGDGLPPVGCECELKFKYHDSDVRWSPVVVLWQRDDDTLVEYVENKLKNAILLIRNTSERVDFRPIRSEADKKRDAAVEDIDYWLPEFIADTPNELYHAKKIYDAIAAGKVRGVKLED